MTQNSWISLLLTSKTFSSHLFPEFWINCHLKLSSTFLSRGEIHILNFVIKINELCNKNKHIIYIVITQLWHKIIILGWTKIKDEMIITFADYEWHLEYCDKLSDVKFITKRVSMGASNILYFHLCKYGQNIWWYTVNSIKPKCKAAQIFLGGFFSQTEWPNKICKLCLLIFIFY